MESAKVKEIRNYKWNIYIEPNKILKIMQNYYFSTQMVQIEINHIFKWSMCELLKDILIIVIIIGIKLVLQGTENISHWYGFINTDFSGVILHTLTFLNTSLL